MIDLASFSKILEGLRNARRIKQDEAYKTAVAEIEETQSSIAALSNEDLLDFLTTWHHSNDSRMNVMNQQFKTYAKKIALRRMIKESI